MAKSKKGKLRSIHIETAGNGYSVRAHHEPDADDKGGPMPVEGHKPMVFSKRKHVRDHVNSLMAEHEGTEPDADDMPKPAATHPIRKLAHKMY